eukprot:GFKZ01011502.1.p1 GENE.GFKZ01011502.1~~GFKZ01011502.1.p1  ORF type:complete len:367 (+),score=42.26 GFKZ01011502.1:101-1201(+)
MPSERLHLLEQDSAVAQSLLSQNNYDYIAGAAGDERTYHANIQAFRSVLFRPRCLIPVNQISTSTHIPHVGKLPIPLLIAPMAAHKLAHPQGECAVARAAKTSKIPMIVSTFATTSLEETIETGVTGLLQLSLFKDRNVTLEILRRGKRAGYKAVVLTVDVPVFGRRERDVKNKFHIPSHLKLANFEKGPSWHEANVKNSKSALESLNSTIEADLSPEALRWVIRNAGMPVWVKGVVRGDDAMVAVNEGAAAIVVSNHGGRQLEGCIPTLLALPEVVEAVQGRVPVLVDSGVRSGEDVVKACALGASAVLLGRPVMWALARGGEKGVRQLLAGIRENVEISMKLCGARSVSDLTRDMVVLQRNSSM